MTTLLRNDFRGDWVREWRWHSGTSCWDVGPWLYFGEGKA